MDVVDGDVGGEGGGGEVQEAGEDAAVGAVFGGGAGEGSVSFEDGDVEGAGGHGW